ncbi:MAG: recombinase RecA [Methanobacteriota archaeon]|nr:MAG: recombinase RecA [Euryarchaeota archaeon]
MTSIGIPALDKSLMEGLPQGVVILVTGSPGSGAELFAKQFASAATGKESMVYFTTTERDEDVTTTMEHFGWKSDIQTVNIGELYYERVLARELEISKYRQEGLKTKDIRKYEMDEEEMRRQVNLLTSLTYEISKLKPPFRIVVDSLDFFLEYYQDRNVLSALRTIKSHIQHNRSVALFTLLTNVHDTRTESGVEEIVDVIIELERQRTGDEFKRYLLIRKVRNHPEKTGIHPYSISKEGITPL